MIKILNLLNIELDEEADWLRSLFNSDLALVKWNKDCVYSLLLPNENPFFLQLSHDVLLFKQEGRIKYRVISNDILGQGAHGHVHVIECSFVFTDENKIEYIEKEQLVVKILSFHYLENSEQSMRRMKAKYEHEYQLTKFASYLAIEPPIFHASSSHKTDVYMVMNKLPGVELFMIFERSYPMICYFKIMLKVPERILEMGLDPEIKLHYIAETNNRTYLYFVDTLRKSITLLPIKPALANHFEALEQIEENQPLTHENLATIFEYTNHTFPDYWFISSSIRFKFSMALIRAYKEQVVALGLVHNDLKLENIIVDMGLTYLDFPRHLDREFNPKFIMMKIIDFATARKEGEQVDCELGTPGCIAPEILNARRNRKTLLASPETDLYSIGIALKIIWGFYGMTCNTLDEDEDQFNADIDATYYNFFQTEADYFTKAQLRTIYEVIAHLTRRKADERCSLEHAFEVLNSIQLIPNENPPVTISKHASLNPTPPRLPMDRLKNNNETKQNKCDEKSIKRCSSWQVIKNIGFFALDEEGIESVSRPSKIVRIHSLPELKS